MRNNIEFKNFGNISEANINISPLTVFIGSNNSGKSFSALLIHCLLKNHNENNNTLPFGLKSLKYLVKYSSELFNEFSSIFNEYFNSKPNLTSSPLEVPVSLFDKLILEGVGRSYLELIENNLKTYFNEDLSKITKVNTTGFEISFNGVEFKKDSYGLSISKFNLKEEFTVKIEDKTVFTVKYTNGKVFISLNYLLLSTLAEEDIDTVSVFYMLLAVNIFKGLNKDNSYYISASRKEWIRNSILKEFNGLIKPNKVETELYFNILSLKDIEKKGDYFDLACEFETELLDGEIRINENINGLGEIIFKDNKQDALFKLDNVSSSVKDIVPLILYLKYKLSKGDTVIIEEPEVHMSPKSQKVLSKYIVKAINNGLNFILTTHSDLLLKEFDKDIKLSNSSKECGVSPNKVNVYCFKETKDGFIPYLLSVNETSFIND